MLLKAIPAAEQQALVTDRVLSSTGIIYKLLVRFQPGGAGEKQLLLTQLTAFPKSKDVQELAAGLRNWRRHFGRAQEVEATLPDGVLLLKAFDAPLQQLGTLDAQAAFRLAQSRMQLQLDQQPSHQSLWAFSQCLLAEAETLVLLQSSSTTTTSSVPLKLKQLDAEVKSPSKTTNNDNKAKPSPTADKPCRYFSSEKGCKAGKSCKWLHSWETLDDRANRCFVCGSKEHKKQDCKLRAKKPGEQNSSGGGTTGQGRGGSETSNTTTIGSSSWPGGKAGAAATAKALKTQDVGSSSMTSSTASPGEVKQVVEEGNKGLGDGGTGGDQMPKTKTDDLLHEAPEVAQGPAKDQRHENWRP
jgi:hypothetical protein